MSATVIIAAPQRRPNHQAGAIPPAAQVMPRKDVRQGPLPKRACDCHVGN
jgi:hypothetical protein